ncbi:MAG: T9SS type A sorting domain-containing protein, partial [Bacteroidota bacterium]
INYLDGTTIWEVPRDFGSSSDGNAPNVYGDKIYLWAQSAQGMYIKALDINTGNILYDSPLLVSPGFQQMGFMVGSDGTIYAGTVRGMGSDKMYALQDDGSQITILWEKPMGYCLWGNHLEGSDGSIYMLNPNEEIERLDPTTGDVINTSSSVSLGDGGLMINMAAGADGSIYVLGNDWPNSKIWFFTADLQELWSENLSGGRGIVVAEDIVFVNGKNTQMKAYGPHDLSIQDMTDVNNLSVYPNPSDGLFTITPNFELSNNGVVIDVINLSGEIVYKTTLIQNNNQLTTVDLSSLSSGIYLLRYFDNGTYHHHKIIKQ